MSACDDLVPFVDGELSDGAVDRFRSHLSICDECRAALVEAVALSVRLADLPSELATVARVSAGVRVEVFDAALVAGILAVAVIAELLFR